MSESPYLEAILLGIVQGIAEFLPISSSGHLVVFGALFRQAFGGDDESSGYLLNIALHVGTLLAILVVYRSDLRFVLRSPRKCGLIVLATIPAAVFGLTFKSRIEATFKEPLLVACGWLITAALLTFAQRRSREEFTLETMRWHDALVIGLFQTVSVFFRGVSRSGSTISGGLICGLKRDAAAAFSFLIAIPAVGGAALVESKPLILHALGRHSPEIDAEVAQLAGQNWGALTAGTVVSFLVGLVVLRWLISVISRGKLHWFAWYCVAAATVTFAWQGWMRLGGS